MKARIHERKLTDGSKVYDVAIDMNNTKQKLIIETDCELTANRMLALIDEYRIVDIYID